MTPPPVDLPPQEPQLPQPLQVQQQPQPSVAQVFIESQANADVPAPTDKQKPRPKYGGQYCCATKCHNNAYKHNPLGIKFHRFPQDPARRLAWAKAVNRKDADSGGLWMPKSNSAVVCSEHFVGGKSDDPSHSGYVPSVFPTHKLEKHLVNQARLRRRMKREEIKPVLQVPYVRRVGRPKLPEKDKKRAKTKPLIVKVKDNQRDKYLQSLFAEFKSDLQKGNHDLVISGYDSNSCKVSSSIACHQLALAAKSPFLSLVLGELANIEDVRIILPDADAYAIQQLFEVIYEPKWSRKHQNFLQSLGMSPSNFIDRLRRGQPQKDANEDGQEVHPFESEKNVQEERQTESNPDRAEESNNIDPWSDRVKILLANHGVGNDDDNHVKMSLKFSQKEFAAIGGRVKAQVGEVDIVEEANDSESVPGCDTLECDEEIMESDSLECHEEIPEDENMVENSDDGTNSQVEQEVLEKVTLKSEITIEETATEVDCAQSTEGPRIAISPIPHSDHMYAQSEMDPLCSKVPEKTAQKSSKIESYLAKCGDLTKKIFEESCTQKDVPILPASTKLLPVPVKTPNQNSSGGGKKVMIIPAKHRSAIQALEGTGKKIVVIKAPRGVTTPLHSLLSNKNYTKVSELIEETGELASVCATCLKPKDASDDTEHQCQFDLDDLRHIAKTAPDRLSFDPKSEPLSEKCPMILPLMLDRKLLEGDFAVCKKCKMIFEASEVKSSDFSHACPNQRKKKARKLKLVKKPQGPRTKNCQCEQCGKQYYTRSELKVHMVVAHGNEKHMCEQCGTVRNSRQGLASHVKTVHMAVREKTIPCETCGTMFRTKDTLKIHNMQHTGERPQKCEICGKGFIQVQNCKQHVKSAHGITIPKGVNVQEFFKKHFEGRAKDSSEENKELSHVLKDSLNKPGSERNSLLDSESHDALDTFDASLL